jgi:cytochrome b involved in lipid metabolism
VSFGAHTQVELQLDMESEKPEGARDRAQYVKKGTIGQWTSIKDTFPACQKCPHVTTEELKRHNTIDDLWTVVRGTVYDCTQVGSTFIYILYPQWLTV